MRRDPSAWEAWGFGGWLWADSRRSGCMTWQAGFLFPAIPRGFPHDLARSWHAITVSLVAWGLLCRSAR